MELPLIEGEEVKFSRKIKKVLITVTDKRIILGSKRDYTDISLRHVYSISIFTSLGLFILGVIILVAGLGIAYYSYTGRIGTYGEEVIVPYDIILVLVARALYGPLVRSFSSINDVPPEAHLVATTLVFSVAIIGLVIAWVGWRNRIGMVVRYPEGRFMIRDGKELEEVAIKIREYVEKVKVAQA